LPTGYRARSHPLDAGAAEVRELSLHELNPGAARIACIRPAQPR
jgi:hypothetical protein